MATTLASGNRALPTSRGASVQWIGVQWQGGSYALPLYCVGAVFRAKHTEQLAEKKILDIEVHAGAAVFVRPFPSCFDFPPAATPAVTEEERRWVVVMSASTASQIGCRVHQVVGPFWAEPISGRVVHAGHDWLQAKPRSVAYA